MEGVASTTGSVGGAALVAAGAVDVVVGAVTDIVTGVAGDDASTPDCSAVGVRVDTNSDALGFNEAELGLTDITAVGAAIWPERMAGTAAVRSWVVLTDDGRIGSTR